MSWDYTVSLIMPVYNGEDFVANAIESVLSQTLESVELVVVNDGSTDDSEAVIEEYLPHDAITYVTQENEGVTETTNRGIRLAEGRYLGVHPQDDTSYPDRLERQVRILERNPGVGLVYGPAQNVTLQGEQTVVWGGWHGEGRIPSEEFFRELYVNGMCIASPSVLFRRDHITDEEQPWGDPDLEVVSDWEHWLGAAQHYDAYEMAEPVIEMTADKDHSNLTKRRETVFREERTVIRRTRRRYADGDPPVTRATCARAMSNHYLRQFRERLYLRRDFPGAFRSNLFAFGHYPINPALYREYGRILARVLSIRDGTSPNSSARTGPGRLRR